MSPLCAGKIELVKERLIPFLLILLLEDLSMLLNTVSVLAFEQLLGNLK